MFVEGGSLYANGRFNVTHRGIENDYLNDEYNSGNYTFLRHEIKSYAVRVTEKQGSLQQTNVFISKGTIINRKLLEEYDSQGGGGVYVSGGTVTLGSSESANNNELQVTTEGDQLYNETYHHVDRYQADGWKYYLSRTGGHAIEVQGGSLTVNSGTYTAAQGNGIFVRNTDSSAVSNQVIINGGNFYGYNTGYKLDSNERKVGPGASAGLYVMGHSLTVNINGGTFGSKGDVSNSAAVFFGTPGGTRAQVYIKGGNFYGSKSDVLSVFRFVDFEFNASDTTTPITVENANGNASAALSVQDDLIYTTYSGRGSTINISNGNFIATGAGIYYGSSVDKLIVSGGTFEGNGDYAINFAKSPGNTQVKLSGGIFRRTNTYVSDVFGGKGYPEDNVNNILESGYRIVENGNTWTVVPN